LGQWILGEKISYSIEEMTKNFEAFKHLKTYLVGSFALAIIMSLIFGLIGYIFFSSFKKKKVE